jgi:hypothetical protein
MSQSQALAPTAVYRVPSAFRNRTEYVGLMPTGHVVAYSLVKGETLFTSLTEMCNRFEWDAADIAYWPMLPNAASFSFFVPCDA